jgi:hypothetical protein
VRLDHLLSKEHSSAKADRNPVPTECVGEELTGGDTGQFFAGNGHMELVHAACCGGTSGGAAGERRKTSILLGI